MPNDTAVPASVHAGITDNTGSAGRRGAPQLFDFRTPNKLGRDHVRALQMVHETFARQVATTFASSLRVISQVNVARLEQRAWSEFAAAVPDPAYLAVITLEPLPGPGVLYLPLPLVMTAVDLLLGGPGTGALPNRPLTEIEAGLVRDLMTRVVHELAWSFRQLVSVSGEVAQQESNLQFAQIAGAADACLVVHYDLRIGDAADHGSLCMPVATLQSVLEAATQLAQASTRARGGAADVRDAVADRLLDTTLEVAVCFPPVDLTPGDILELRPGDVLPLHHPVGVPLAVLAEGRQLYTAMPGRRGKHLACIVVDQTTEDL